MRQRRLLAPPATAPNGIGRGHAGLPLAHLGDQAGRKAASSAKIGSIIASPTPGSYSSSMRAVEGGPQRLGLGLGDLADDASAARRRAGAKRVEVVLRLGRAPDRLQLPARREPWPPAAPSARPRRGPRCGASPSGRRARPARARRPSPRPRPARRRRRREPIRSAETSVSAAICSPLRPGAAARHVGLGVPVRAWCGRRRACRRWRSGGRRGRRRRAGVRPCALQPWGAARVNGRSGGPSRSGWPVRQSPGLRAGARPSTPAAPARTPMGPRRTRW